MKTISVQIDWRYDGFDDTYSFYNKQMIVDDNPIGKYCALLKYYMADKYYINDEWGFLKNVMFSIQDGIPIDFDGDAQKDCYLIKIESVL